MSKTIRRDAETSERDFRDAKVQARHDRTMRRDDALSADLRALAMDALSSREGF